LAFLALGDQERYGVPLPRHAIWKEHATLSQELLPHAGHGWIRFRPDIRTLLSDAVEFEDGSIEPVDAIIYATGYRICFPFIDRALFEVRDGNVALYRRMLPPHLPGLYMVGLVQPGGPTIPLVEVQARWLASLLAGEIKLPERKMMDAEIAGHERHNEKRYVGSARYTLGVDFKNYARQVRANVARGRAAG
jgi:dimethylaniline monooxygenase (N-oxide forming)